MTYRIRNIGLAVVLALVAALLTTFYVTNYKRTVQESHDSVTVLVAKRDIPVGTAGSDVLAGGLTPRKIARQNVVPGAITSPQKIANLVAAETILAGEQVTTRRFATLEQSGLDGRYTGNRRALQLPGDTNQLLIGTLKPGDRIDVVAAFKKKLPDGTETTVSRTILRDIEVLDISADTGDGAKVAPGGGGAWAQLALTDAQASKLWVAKVEGEWTLDLRPAVKAADSPENIETVDTVLRDGLSPRQIQRLGMGG